MKYLARILAPMLIFLLFLQSLPTNGQENNEKEPWTGKLADGTVITEEDLRNVLADHQKWVFTDKEEGDKANLSNTDLRNADLTNAHLDKADLTNANLALANLTNAVLLNANLTNVILFKADLTNAVLIEADLTNADLGAANLTNANLARADLTKADLAQANLTKANLTGAILNEETSFFDANLEGAVFWEVELPAIRFEPKAGSPPYIPAMATAENLSSLTFARSSHGLIDLREGFKKAGLREQERQITYAIKYTERGLLWNEGDIWDKLESLFNLFMFELTCQYGMSPGRPLLLLCVLIPVFSIFYVIALGVSGQRTGIWVVRPQERVLKGASKGNPLKVTSRRPFRPLPEKGFARIRGKMSNWLRILRVGLYFSLLSAFTIGWRELNVGNWISRVQRREYNLRATGWVRSVSGIQSLLSVYLLALWALTYFGRPFE